MRRLALLLVASLAAHTSDLGAQPVPGVSPGRRVRVTAPTVGAKGLDATVESIRGDTLVLRVIVDPWLARYGYPVDTGVRVALGVVERLEVRRSVRGSRLATGFAVGVISGAALGFALGNDEFPVREALATTLAPVGGLVGLVTAYVSAERWQPVPLEGPGVGVGARRRGPGIALGLSAIF